MPTGSCGRWFESDDDLYAIQSYQSDHYPPSWNGMPLHDVAYPWSAACAAITALREKAADLRTCQEERGDPVGDPYGEPLATTDTSSMVAAATSQWRGGHRANFDVSHAGLKTVQDTLIEKYEAKAAEIEDAWDAAKAENALRQENRDEYDVKRDMDLAQAGESSGA